MGIYDSPKPGSSGYTYYSSNPNPSGRPAPSSGGGGSSYVGEKLTAEEIARAEGTHPDSPKNTGSRADALRELDRLNQLTGTTPDMLANPASRAISQEARNLVSNDRTQAGLRDTATRSITAAGTFGEKQALAERYVSNRDGASEQLRQQQLRQQILASGGSERRTTTRDADTGEAVTHIRTVGKDSSLSEYSWADSGQVKTFVRETPKGGGRAVQTGSLSYIDKSKVQKTIGETTGNVKVDVSGFSNIPSSNSAEIFTWGGSPKFDGERTSRMGFIQPTYGNEFLSSTAIIRDPTYDEYVKLANRPTVTGIQIKKAKSRYNALKTGAIAVVGAGKSSYNALKTGATEVGGVYYGAGKAGVKAAVDFAPTAFAPVKFGYNALKTGAREVGGAYYKAGRTGVNAAIDFAPTAFAPVKFGYDALSTGAREVGGVVYDASKTGIKISSAPVKFGYNALKTGATEVGGVYYGAGKAGVKAAVDFAPTAFAPVKFGYNALKTGATEVGGVYYDASKAGVKAAVDFAPTAFAPVKFGYNALKTGATEVGGVFYGAGKSAYNTSSPYVRAVGRDTKRIAGNASAWFQSKTGIDEVQKIRQLNIAAKKRGDETFSFRSTRGVTETVPTARTWFGATGNVIGKGAEVLSLESGLARTTTQAWKNFQLNRPVNTFEKGYGSLVSTQAEVDRTARGIGTVTKHAVQEGVLLPAWVYGPTAVIRGASLTTKAGRAASKGRKYKNILGQADVVEGEVGAEVLYFSGGDRNYGVRTIKTIEDGWALDPKKIDVSKGKIDRRLTIPTGRQAGTIKETREIQTLFGKKIKEDSGTIIMDAEGWTKSTIDYGKGLVKETTTGPGGKTSMTTLTKDGKNVWSGKGVADDTAMKLRAKASKISDDSVKFGDTSRVRITASKTGEATVVGQADAFGAPIKSKISTSRLTAKSLVEKEVLASESGLSTQVTTTTRGESILDTVGARKISQVIKDDTGKASIKIELGQKIVDKPGKLVDKTQVMKQGRLTAVSDEIAPNVDTIIGTTFGQKTKFKTIREGSSFAKKANKVAKEADLFPAPKAKPAPKPVNFQQTPKGEADIKFVAGEMAKASPQDQVMLINSMEKLITARAGKVAVPKRKITSASLSSQKTQVVKPIRTGSVAAPRPIGPAPQSIYAGTGAYELTSGAVRMAPAARVEGKMITLPRTDMRIDILQDQKMLVGQRYDQRILLNQRYDNKLLYENKLRYDNRILLDQRLLARQDIALEQNMFARQDVLTSQKYAQKLRTRQAIGTRVATTQNVKITQKQRLIQRIRARARARTKLKLTPRLKIPLLPLRTTPTSSKAGGGLGATKKQGYVPQIKEKGKWKKVSNKIHTEREARAIAGYVVDHSTAVQMRLIKSKKKPVKARAGRRIDRSKFRDYSYRGTKKTPLANKGLIENKAKRIDTRGEKKQLSAAKVMKGKGFRSMIGSAIKRKGLF